MRCERIFFEIELRNEGRRVDWRIGGLKRWGKPLLLMIDYLRLLRWHPLFFLRKNEAAGAFSR
jgi:hypothetical protein